MKTIRLGLICAVATLYAVAPATADHAQMHGGSHGEHAAHGAAIEIPPGPAAPTLAIALTKDPVAGWNLNLRTTNFRYAPEHASLPYIAGEGHAHLYANGRKIARIYGPWFHIESLPEGEVELRVELNANDHRSLSVAGQTLRATTRVRNGEHAHH